MKLYFAGPLFSAAERAWNADVAQGLRDGGHEVFLPQEQEPGKDAAGIFSTDVAGIDWADALVAIMDGADPDSGTAWECGYAYGKKPIVLVGTDIRTQTGSGALLQRDARRGCDDPARPAFRASLARRHRGPRRAPASGGYATTHRLVRHLRFRPRPTRLGMAVTPEGRMRPKANQVRITLVASTEGPNGGRSRART